MPVSRRSSRPKRTSSAGAEGPKRGVTDFLSRAWVPVVFFALLAVGYFYHFIFMGDMILGSDTGTEFHRGNEPFAEALGKLRPANWSRFLGGTPESASLRAQYYPLVVIDLFTSQHRYFGWRYVFAMFTGAISHFSASAAWACIRSPHSSQGSRTHLRLRSSRSRSPVTMRK